MKEKIYKYLADKNKSVPYKEIIEKFFYTSGHYPPQLENIVDNMLNDDDRFIRDGEKEWSVKKIEPRLLTDMVFSIVELETISIDRKRELPLFVGIAQVQHAQIISNQIFSIDTALNYSQQLKDIIHQRKKALSLKGTLTAHANQIYRSLQQTVLVHYAPTKIITRLNYFFRTITGLELDLETISLVGLARKLSPGIKIRSIEDIALALNISYQQPMDLPGCINLIFEILNQFIEKLSQLQINTYEELTTFLDQGKGLIDFSGYKFNREYIKNLPQTPGVYLMKGRAGEVFYVGKAKNLRTRVEGYFFVRVENDEKKQKILTRLYDLTYQQVASELEALLLEHEFIKQYQPEINTQINIHPLDLSKYQNRNVVLFLPDLSDDHIVLFFIKGTVAATKIQLNRKHPDWQLCDKLLFEYFFNPQQAKNDFSDEQIEIIWRWININQEVVNFIDVEQVGTKSNCMDKIKKYVADDELVARKIYYL